jgi:hypothetical protein
MCYDLVKEALAHFLLHSKIGLGSGSGQALNKQALPQVAVRLMPSDSSWGKGQQQQDTCPPKGFQVFFFFFFFFLALGQVRSNTQRD